MTKTLTQGQALLGVVAAAYRADPRSWCPGWGYINGSPIELEPGPGILKYMRPCCIDVMLMKHGPGHGGHDAIDEARQLLYTHFRIPDDPEVKEKRQYIWNFNDQKDRTVEQVISCLEAAAGITIIPEGKLFEFVAQNPSTKVPALAA